MTPGSKFGTPAKLAMSESKKRIILKPTSESFQYKSSVNLEASVRINYDY